MKIFDFNSFAMASLIMTQFGIQVKDQNKVIFYIAYEEE